ncbi:uncharacterized protein LOC117100536 [Anneissia japonica]|uniref:uncharacterized protein LOC117100536 n=1 Tax=Anneissia japonica TaxID=1529436 RepID=UPI0014258D06|nr:uncharacterized protein LOC117100536 [Anneissia japonica]
MDTMTTSNTLKIITVLLLGCICLTESVPVLRFSGQISLETDGESGAVLPWVLMSKMLESDRFMNTDLDGQSEYYSGEENNLDVTKRGSNRETAIKQQLFGGRLRKVAGINLGRKPGGR